MTRHGAAAPVPPAVLAHERLCRLPIPPGCPHCGAVATALWDNHADIVRCLLCGWEFLYLRPACAVPGGARAQPAPRRGRGRRRRAA